MDIYTIRVVLLTLGYSLSFKFPLTASEITTRQLRLDPQRKLLSFKTVCSVLDLLEKKQLISRFHRMISFSWEESCFAVRQQRGLYSWKKWQEVSELITLLKKIPWIKAIFITGALSVNNAKCNDDVDVLIVTQKHRLWVTRIVVNWIAFRKGKRRSWHGEEENSWCFNMWLEDSHLALFPKMRNVYTAHEVLQAVCVYDTCLINIRFLNENNWVKGFLPVFFKKKMAQLSSRNKVDFPIPSSDHPKKENSMLKSVFFGWIVSILNWCCYVAQFVYMTPHRSKEKVGLSHALFHPRNTKSLIMERWKHLLS